MLKTGQMAPDFEAKLDDGSSFRLSDERGKRNVVLYFYPADFSGGCTAQACSFRDSYAAIGAYDAVIYGVSRDDEASHRDFKAKNSLSFPLISDLDRRIHDLYEVKTSVPILRPRITYVIDKAGVIHDAFRHDIAIGRHLKDTLAALESIQAARA